MKKYKIEIENAAERDMYDILSYITETLKEPALALRIYKSIKEQIGKLSTMPARSRIVDDHPSDSGVVQPQGMAEHSGCRDLSCSFFT